MKTLQKFILILILALIISLPTLYNYLYSNRINHTLGDRNANSIVDILSKINYESYWDSSEQYRITPGLALARPGALRKDITLVTQCSQANLYSLVKLAESWQGPISIAVFSKPADVIETVTYIERLRQCFNSISQYVTFHLVTYEGNGNLKYSSVEPRDCSTLITTHNKMKNYDLSVPYPVNLMRNVARRSLASDYFFLIDIDMVPSPHLRRDFLQLTVKLALRNKTVYIVPAFELEPSIPPPLSKAELTSLVKKGLMRPFYTELCPKCHACVDYPSWLELAATEGLSPAYKTDWSDPCEPFYIAGSHVPLHDELFKQYGFNRISQVCELYVAGYEFTVFDNAYLTHLGMKTKEDFHSTKEMEQEANRKRFREFKHKLLFKYPNSPRRC